MFLVLEGLLVSGETSSADAVTHSQKNTHRYSLGKLEDVKDELFHFDAVRFVGFDELTLRVHIWDLLLGHMVLQLWFMLPDI